jgi:hypothetical protein
MDGWTEGAEEEVWVLLFILWRLHCIGLVIALLWYIDTLGFYVSGHGGRA